MEACHLYKSVIAGAPATDEDALLSQIKTPVDAVALAVHGWAILNGWSLPASASNRLDDSWQSRSPDLFTFRYSAPEAGTVDVSVSRLGPSTAMVNAESGNKFATARIDTTKVTNSAFFQRPDGSEELRDVFASDRAVDELMENLSENLGQFGKKDLDKTAEAAGKVATETESRPVPQSRLRPDSTLRDGEYSQASTPNTPGTRPLTPSFTPDISPGHQNARRSNLAPDDPNAPPGFEDEYQMGQDMGFIDRGIPGGGLPGGGIPGGGGRPPYGPAIGDRDLYPPGLGPNPPMAPFLGPGTNPGVGGGRGGGMHPSMDDPLFRGQFSEGPNDLSRPSGSRWDPPGPGGRFGGFGPTGFM